MHADAVIGVGCVCDVSWEYESVCMTSLLFTGIWSFLFPIPTYIGDVCFLLCTMKDCQI